MEVIRFTKVALPYGWLGNMSPFPLEFGGKQWRTSEALFQALRFKDQAIQELIREEKSPMGAKFIMKAHKEHLTIEPHSKKDVMNMKMCLKLKLQQHPSLVEELINTGDKIIIEDVTARGDRGGNLFWGAMLVDDEWVGENTLGKLWMDLRKEHQNLQLKK
ncbi:MAG: NADAR family protein [Spirochaetes bacterium]|nr:MAG: NADAR family protein [Spirochaetota bacterium]